MAGSWRGGWWSNEPPSKFYICRVTHPTSSASKAHSSRAWSTFGNLLEQRSWLRKSAKYSTAAAASAARPADRRGSVGVPGGLRWRNRFAHDWSGHNSTRRRYGRRLTEIDSAVGFFPHTASRTGDDRGMSHLQERWEGVSLPGNYLLQRWVSGDEHAGFF